MEPVRRYGGKAVRGGLKRGAGMNFAIVGCGVIAFTHATALKALRGEGCALYAVCDVDEGKAAAFAQNHGARRVYSRYQDVMRDPAVDIVCVCVPSGIHGEVCVAAARAKKAIVCEKPMEITPEKVAEVAAAVRQAGVKMQCVFQRRMMPAAVAVREAVARGQLGNICLAGADLRYWRDQAYYDSAGWRGTWELDGGGALMNQGIHGIDLILWMLGENKVTVQGKALTATRDIPVEDTAAAVLRLSGGGLCVIQGCTTAYPGYSSTFYIHGEKGSVIFSDEGILQWSFLDEAAAPPRPGVGERVGGASDPATLGAYGHICLLRDIVQAVRQDREPLIPPEDAALAVKVICGIYQSSKTNACVEVEA